MEGRRAPLANAGHAVERWLSSSQVQRHWPAAAAVVLGLALRLYDIWPNALYGDEAEYGAVARSLASDPRALEYPDIERVGPAPFVSQPPAVLYLFAFAARLFGSVDLGGLVVSVLFGLGTIVVCYAIGHRVHGRLAGSFAALFAAVVPVHVTLSRQVMLDGGLVFFTALTILFFLVWEGRRTPRWAVATGAAGALATLSKLYGGLVLVPLAVGLLVALRLSRGRAAEQRSLLVEGALMAATVAIACLSYLVLVLHLQALRDLSEKLLWQFGRVAAVAGPAAPSLGSDQPWHWYFTDTTMGLPGRLGAPIFVLAVVGGVLFARRMRGARTAGAVAFLAWPVVVLLFFTMSGRKVWFYPAAAVPGLVVLAGIAAADACAWMRAFLDREQALDVADRRLAWGVLLAVVVVVPAAVPTFAVATALAERGGGYGAGVQDAAEWIHANDPAAAQVGTILGRFTLSYYNGQPTYHAYTPHDFVDREIEAGRVRFVVVDEYQPIPPDQAWLDSLVERHGGTEVHAYSEPNGWIMVRVFEVRPQAQATAQAR